MKLKWLIPDKYLLATVAIGGLTALYLYDHNWHAALWCVVAELLLYGNIAARDERDWYRALWRNTVEVSDANYKEAVLWRERYAKLYEEYNALLAQKTAVVKVEGGAQ